MGTEDKKQKIIDKVAMLQGLLAVMNAYESGEQVQSRLNPTSKWYDILSPDWIGNPTDYRIKPPAPKVFYLNQYNIHYYETDSCVAYISLTDALNDRSDNCLGTFKCTEVVDD